MGIPETGGIAHVESRFGDDVFIIPFPDDVFGPDPGLAIAGIAAQEFNRRYRPAFQKSADGVREIAKSPAPGEFHQLREDIIFYIWQYFPDGLFPLFPELDLFHLAVIDPVLQQHGRVMVIGRRGGIA